MAVFLWDEFQTIITTSSITSYQQAARQHPKEQNADLRDYYLHNLSEFQSYHMIYIDESECDKRFGFRRTGWAPLGKAPLQVTQFHRDQRYQILPAYIQDGILLSRVFRGSTDATVQGFDVFLEWCINVVGVKEQNARGHFRHAGLEINFCHP
ncbi:hypothetical protein N7541_000131 [Penicillium brevicompactum]|uniref:Transposase n=1 Tax=Penicillium brevicompactum TaxID=5074 RepID=A0A9W9V4H8_PENBR|nr:hypothetical protein N7541_000131 [Penicillium brevicompactum]